MDYTEEELVELIAQQDKHESFYRGKLAEIKKLRRAKKLLFSTGCTYCGARPGEPCVLTLVPEVGPLSITWQHRTREDLVA